MVEIINFILKNWKYLVILLIGIFIGSYITGKILIFKYHNLQDKYNGCVTSLNGCLSTNEENMQTIKTLQKEVLLNKKTCEERVNYYKKLLNDIQNIDNLSGGNNEANITNCPDDVCALLNRMWK